VRGSRLQIPGVWGQDGFERSPRCDEAFELTSEFLVLGGHVVEVRVAFDRQLNEHLTVSHPRVLPLDARFLQHSFRPPIPLDEGYSLLQDIVIRYGLVYWGAGVAVHRLIGRHSIVLGDGLYLFRYWPI